jgi:hypothetical protein
MSNTKHTPGPWYEYDMGWLGQTAIACKSGNVNRLVVAAMNKGANARLIAAAPELLEALMRLDAYHSLMVSSVDRQAIRDAIAKATQP